MRGPGGTGRAGGGLPGGAEPVLCFLPQEGPVPVGAALPPQRAHGKEPAAEARWRGGEPA